MTVIVANDVPAYIRGHLKRWFLEPRPNVFVGTLNPRTHDKVLQFIVKHAPPGLRFPQHRLLAQLSGLQNRPLWPPRCHWPSPHGNLRYPPCRMLGPAREGWMKTLVIDTETTGLTHLAYATPANFKKWPRLVQLAWILADGDRILQEGGGTIRPQGFIIPAQATSVHGISQDRAVETGQPVYPLLCGLANAMGQAGILVAHNVRFDTGVLQSEAIRLDLSLPFPSRQQCTMRMGQEYLAKNNAQANPPYPKLTSLYLELFGSPFEHTHTAPADVHACFQVYLKLLATLAEG
jgi:DNA polymerase-3 subunit epsilon